jgi:hypothetical protein
VTRENTLEERRTDLRVPLNLPARYDGLSGAVEARVEDISVSGCFINTRGQVNEGETINVEIQLSSGELLHLPGRVTSHQPGIGFGVAFDNLSSEQMGRLLQLIIS